MSKPVHIPFVGPEVEKLLLWKDVKSSGIVCGGVTAVYLAARLNPWPVLSVVLLLISVLSLAGLLWAQLGAVVGRSGPPVPAILQKGLSDAEMKKYAEAALPVINKFLATLGVLWSGRDLRLSVMVMGGAYSAARFFARFFARISPLTLVFVAVAVAFSAPKAYELKRDDIDKVIAVIKQKLEELKKKFDDAVMKKIPKASTASGKFADAAAKATSSVSDAAAKTGDAVSEEAKKAL